MRLNDPTDTRSLSYRLRAKRDVFLREFMLQCGRRVLDIGGTSAYWERVGVPFLERHGFEITILNKHSSEIGDGPFDAVVGDATETGLSDNSFDLVHSNSVIEHVGGREAMLRFAGEVRRLAPAHYIQTPNRAFPIDPHFPRFPAFQHLPRNWRIGLLRRLPIATAGKIATRESAAHIVDHTRLLSAQDARHLFPDSELRFETFLGFRKSLILTRSASRKSAD